MQSNITTVGTYSLPAAMEFGAKTGFAKLGFLIAVHLPITMINILAVAICKETFGPYVAALLTMPLVGGYTAIILGLVDGRNPQFSELFSKASIFWKYLLLNICVNFCIIVGMIFLLGPGIFAAILFAFVLFCMTEDNLGPIEAMKRSAELGKGYRWQILGLFFMTILFAIVLGLAGALIIGLPGYFIAQSMHLDMKAAMHLFMPIIMMPVLIITQLMVAHSYRQLTVLKSVAGPQIAPEFS